MARISRYKKGQEKPYLLTAASHEISTLTAVPRTEPQAIQWLAKMRWGKLGENVQACPHCGAIDTHYWIKTKTRWSCRAKLCRRQFSVTTETKFHSTKLSAREIISILFQFQEAVEGISSRHMAGLHDMGQQPMNIITHKIREALWESWDHSPLTGEVEADAAYFFKYKRPPNAGTGTSFGMKAVAKAAGIASENKQEAAKEATTAAPTADGTPPTPETDATAAAPTETTSAPSGDATKAEKEKDPDTMHALVAFIERGTTCPGGQRVRVAVIKTENQLDLLKLGKEFVDKDATVITDEHSGYNLFSGRFVEHRQVNHKVAFKDEDGTHTNYVEGFFAQMRRMQAGAYHRMGLGYLELYATEMAWRYEMRRTSNLTKLEDLARRCLTTGLPKRFADYWDKRPKERRIAKPAEGTMAFEIPKGSMRVKRGRPKKSKDKPPPAVELQKPAIAG